MLKRLLVTALIAVSGTVNASPALDLFNQATYYIASRYNGFSLAPLEALSTQFRPQLDAACAGQLETCPYSAAVPVVQQMLETISDGHSYLLLSAQRDEAQRQRSGLGPASPRLGIATREVIGSADRLIADVWEDSPAAAAGLRRGDRLVSVNGQLSATLGQDFQPSIARAISSGSSVRLGVQRGAVLLEVTVRGAVSGAIVSHRARAIPGDPVLVRISDVPAVAPLVTWGSEALVMTRDGEDWVGIGRELLGAKPKVIALRVNLGSEIISSSLKLMPDPQAIQNVFMSKQVLSTLTDKNRNLESSVLNAAHAKSVVTPRVWTKSFIWPVQPPRSVSPFAQARLYERGGQLNFHYGEDMAGKIGAPIRATNDGTVEVAGQYAIRGGLTGINHGAGVVSLYFHQSQILVKVGQKVTRGQVIGRIGATGFVTGPHLHWEMRVRAEATDPRQWADRIFPR